MISNTETLSFTLVYNEKLSPCKANWLMYLKRRAMFYFEEMQNIYNNNIWYYA